MCHPFFLKYLVPVALLLLLSGCGGGGGGGSDEPPTGGTPPVTPVPPTPPSNPPPTPLLGDLSPAPASYGFTAVRFIDGSLGRDCLNQYAPNSRSCGSGGDTAYRTFAAADAAAAPGVQFIVRGGDYREVLHLRTSGTASAYIGYTEEAGESVVIRGVNSEEQGEDYGPIWLDHVSRVLVRGFTVRESVGFLRAVDAHYNVLEDLLFDGSVLFPDSSKRGGLYFAWSTHNKVLNSTINRGTDSLSLVHSDHNVIHGNTFRQAGHDVWNIKCGSFNVIRANEVTNPVQKLGSVFDCETDTVAWHGNDEFAQAQSILDRTRRNLIDGNVLHDSVDYYSTSGGNGIQYAGQQGIIRRNIFYGNNVGLGMTQYPDEAQFNYGNRVYGNVFHDNHCGGIAVAGATGSGRVEDNLYRNNVLWDNKGWQPDDSCAGISAGQVLYRTSLTGHRFIRNLIASPLGTAVVREEFGAEAGIGAFAGDGSFERTVEQDPAFVATANHNYSAAAGSPLIDAGEPLTTTLGAGSGRVLDVADASWFYDGFGIEAEQGDVVQLDGQTTSARIVRIDYDDNRITVDRDLTWQDGQGLSLAYVGAAPDIGVFER